MNRQVKLGATIAYSSIVISLVIGIIYTPFMLSKMGESEYGIYNLALTIVTYLNVLDTGFAVAVVRYISFYKAKNDILRQQQVISTSFVLYITLGVLSLLIGGFFVANIDLLYTSSLTAMELKKLKIVVVILVLYLSIHFPASVFSSIIMANERFAFLKGIKLLSTILMPLIMTPLLIMGHKSISMVVVSVLLGLMSSMFYLFYCFRVLKIRFSHNTINKEILFLLVKYSLPIFVIMGCDCICRSFGSFYIGTLYGTISVTILTLAIQIRGYAESIVKAITSFFLPIFSSMVAGKASTEVVNQQFISVTRFQLHVALCILFGFLILGKEFLYYWTRGLSVNDIYITSLIILIPLTFSMAESSGEELVKAVGKQKTQMMIYVLRTVVLVLSTMLMAKKYNYYACAIGIGLSIIICDIFLMNILYSKMLGIKLKLLLKSILYPCIIFFTVSALAFILDNIYPLSILNKIFLFLFIYVIPYLFWGVSADERNFLINQINRKK